MALARFSFVADEAMLRRLFWFSVAVLLICWAPWIVIHWPGSVDWDGLRQLNQTVGIRPLSNWDPWLVTVFYYWPLLWLGRLVNDNIGIFTIILANALLSAACYATIIRHCLRLVPNYVLFIILLVGFGVLPICGAFVQVVVKDAIWLPLYALFISLCIQSYFQQRRRNFIRLALMGVVICFVRNNGVYLAALSLITLCCLLPTKQIRRQAGLALFAVATVYLLMSCFITPALKIGPTNKQDSLAIPLQGIARYVKEYPQDLSAAQRKLIDDKLNLQTLADRYNPINFDKVKNNGRAGIYDSLAWIPPLWLQLAARHPGVMIEAFLHNSYAYYYPYAQPHDFKFYQCKSPMVWKGNFHWNYAFSEDTREYIKKYITWWQRTPLLHFFVSPAFPALLMLAVASALLYLRRSQLATLALLPFFNVLVCCASPINNSIRYASGSYVCFGTVLALLFYALLLPPVEATPKPAPDWLRRFSWPTRLLALLVLLSLIGAQLPTHEQTMRKLQLAQQTQAQRKAQREARTARIDIKNLGSAGNSIMILENSGYLDPSTSITTPNWYRDGKGIGQMVQSARGDLMVKFRCLGNGKLVLTLRGLDKRDKSGQRIPIWIEYTEFTVNGQPALTAPTAVWHDQPLKLEQAVRDGEQFTLHAKWRPHLVISPMTKPVGVQPSNR